MISVAEAVARIVAAFSPLDSESVTLEKAHGRVLVAPMMAGVDQPPFAVSAMDGYALRADDAPPLRLIGAAAAGHPFDGRIGAGEAVRIFTGAAVPQGADTVLIQEDAAVENDGLTFAAPLDKGRHIRAQGGDFAKGDVLAAAGRKVM